MKKYLSFFVLLLILALVFASCDITIHEHSYGEWTVVKEPTKTDRGLKERTCWCGEKETQEIPMKGSEGLKFTLNNDGLSYSVTGIGTCTDTDVVIPDTYEGLPVTSIGNGAFTQCTSLTNVVIPDSVTNIDRWAFSYCTNLESIVIPDSVTSIGDYAFFNCTSLTIYCEATSKPSGWNSEWNSADRPVVWGYARN